MCWEMLMLSGSPRPLPRALVIRELTVSCDLCAPQGAATPTELAERVVAVAEKRIKPMLTVWMGEH
jgi:hypothetical protein